MSALTSLERAQRLDDLFKRFSRRTEYLRALIAALEHKLDALVLSGKLDQAEDIAIKMEDLTQAATIAEETSILIYKKSMALRAEHYSSKRSAKPKT